MKEKEMSEYAKRIALFSSVAFVVAVAVVATIFYLPIHNFPNSTTTTLESNPYVVTIMIEPNATFAPRDRSFVPNNAVVILGYNSTVNWYNNDTGIEHTITANGSDSSLDPSFVNWASASNDINYRQTLTFTFTKAGIYGYYDAIHPTADVGTISVIPSSCLSNPNSSPLCTVASTTTSASITTTVTGNTPTTTAIGNATES